MILPQERQDVILKMLRKFRSVKISEVSSELGVSRETIRKDIYEMDEKGLIRRVRGGAVLNKSNFETSYTKRKSTNEAEKLSIAKKAAEYVEDGETIYIDYGTTAFYFSRNILGKKDLTIITNSLPIANELINYSDFEVIIIGGNVRKNENSLYGPIAYRAIENLFVEKGFFGISGIHLDAGYTNVHMGESEVSRLMLANSQKRFMMADYSKFNTAAMNRVAAIEEVDVLITDKNADPKLIGELEKSETTVIRVKLEGSVDIG